jgi:L-seryl-tRNA(Ser) seleniumtransferase
MTEPLDAIYRRLPAVGAVLESDGARALEESYPRGRVRDAIREVLDAVREAIRRDPGSFEDLGPDEVLDRARRLLERRDRPGIRRVVNASGVILHTGLGRAVLAEEAREALRREAGTYCSLAMRMSDGGRTYRERYVVDLIRQLTGAEAATVVNNNAAATLIAISATAAGREAIISRGQLVEIGGSYRLPDVMDQSGARMVAVGTTNKTHLRDYRDAINENTGLLIRVHTSNYKIMGFASEVPLADLVALGREHGIPVFDDLGAGAFIDLEALGFPEEPVVADSIRTGADLITCSSDKLIGGSQGGIVLGRADLVRRIREHPLFRCVRVGKLDLIALEATLRLFLDPETLLHRHPTLRMMTATLDDLAERAERLGAAVAGVVGEGTVVEIEDGVSRAGSGSLPTHDLPTRLVSIRAEGVEPGLLSRRLREQDVPVISRVHRDRVLLDPRTIQEGDEEDVVAAVAAVLGSGGGDRVSS